MACGDEMATTKKMGINGWYTHRHPCGVVMSRNIIDVLGYMFYPEIDCFMADVYQRDLAEGIDRLFFMPDVKIEHCHPIAGYPTDEVREEVQSTENRAKGRKAFFEWLYNHSKSDIKKLREAITKDTGEQW